MKSAAAPPVQTPRLAHRLRPKDATPKRPDLPISAAAKPLKIVPKSLIADFASTLPDESPEISSDLISTVSSHELTTAESVERPVTVSTDFNPFEISLQPVTGAPDLLAAIHVEVEKAVDDVASRILDDLVEIVIGNVELIDRGGGYERLVFYRKVRIGIHCLLLLIGVLLLFITISPRGGRTLPPELTPT